MDEFDIRILIVLLLVIFGSTLAAFVRKMKNKIFKPGAPVFDVVFEFEDRAPVHQTGIMVPLPEGLISGAVSAYESVQDLPEISDKLLPILEEKFLAGQKNKPFARAALQTFRAWHTGVMLTILDPDSQFSNKAKKPFQPKINNPEFEQFVLYTFLGVQNSQLMPRTMESIQDQYRKFFQSDKLAETEYHIGWAQQAMLTSRNLVIFNSGKTPDNLAVIPIPEIKRMSLNQTGMEKLS